MVSQSELIDVPPWRPEHCTGGHPALDLVNTISHRRDPSLAIDRMDRANKIAFWCAYQGLLSDRDVRALVRLCQARGAEAAFVASVDELRGAAAEIFDALASQEELPAGALAQVLLAAADARVALVDIPDDHRDASRLSVREIAVDAVVASMALLVLDAVFRLPRARVRSCPRCGWLFCDSSKGGRRRWCSMEACGNREKVSRHYWSKQR